MHLPLIVERAEPVAQRLSAQHGRRRRAGGERAQRTLADGEFARVWVTLDDECDLTLQKNAHCWLGGALGDDALRPLEPGVDRVGGIQERLQGLGRRDQL